MTHSQRKFSCSLAPRWGVVRIVESTAEIVCMFVPIICRSCAGRRYQSESMGPIWSSVYFSLCWCLLILCLWATGSRWTTLYLTTIITLSNVILSLLKLIVSAVTSQGHGHRAKSKGRVACRSASSLYLRIVNSPIKSWEKIVYLSHDRPLWVCVRLTSVWPQQLPDAIIVARGTWKIPTTTAGSSSYPMWPNSSIYSSCVLSATAKII